MLCEALDQSSMTPSQTAFDVHEDQVFANKRFYVQHGLDEEAFTLQNMVITTIIVRTLPIVLVYDPLLDILSLLLLPRVMGGKVRVRADLRSYVADAELQTSSDNKLLQLKMGSTRWMLSM